MKASANPEALGPKASADPARREPGTPPWDEHDLAIAELAEQYVHDLNELSRHASKLRWLARVGRFVHRIRQWFRRKGRELIQEHWDVGLFDVAFGSLKAFAIYPALYLAGLTWTIPIMEYLPLNTQLWTAGYIFCRRNLLSTIGRFRYGHSLNEMNKHRDRLLGIDPRDARSIHRVAWHGEVLTIRVRRSMVRDLIRRLRRKPREPNVILHSELRKMVDDEEFLYQANELRNNAYLYEAILIRKILEGPDSARLTQQLQPEPPLDEQGREFRQLLGESPEPTIARVVEQGNSLTDTLKQNLGDKFSATSMSIRWINWAYQRRTYRLLSELGVLQYRLLAQCLDGRAPEMSSLREPILEKRRQIQDSIDAAARFDTRAKQLTTKSAAQQVIRDGINEAQAAGLKVRLARIAWHQSPTRKQGEV